jgi:hypothetical protein
VLFVSFIRDVTTSDPIGYFSRQPRQMLVVAAIAVATALMMAGFHKLPPLWRRRVYLLVLAMAASIMTVAIGWAGFLFFRLPHFWEAPDIGMGLVALLFGAAISTLLWIEFYNLYRKPIV